MYILTTQNTEGLLLQCISVSLGPFIEICDMIIMDPFIDFVSLYERKVLKEDLQVSHTGLTFAGDLRTCRRKSAALIVGKSPHHKAYSNLFMALHDMSFS